MRAIRVSIAALTGALLVACGPASPGPASDGRTVGHLRSEGERSKDSELVGRWALAEMVAPDGDAAHGAAARKRLEELGHEGLYASVARAIADEAHGEPRSAAEAYVATLRAAQSSKDPSAPLIAWFSTHHLMGLRGSVADLYEHERPTLEGLMAKPERLGWRAVADLEEWWATEVFDRAESTGDAYDALVTTRMGCSNAIRMAGPFGHGSTQDRHRAFAAEDPAPWPTSWPEDPLRGTLPHVLNVERHRCLAASSEAMPEGIFYAETFFTTRGDRDVLVAAQGAVKLWIDDHPVLERDPREWGSWQKFGVAVTVKDGRHRVLARVPGIISSVRVMNLDGTSAGVDMDANADRPYSLEEPVLLADPNPIARFVAAPAGATPIEAFFAAYAAHNEGLDDVASVLIEPLVSSPRAAPLALSSAAEYTQQDPAIPDDVKQRNAKSFRSAAAAKDPKLWTARMALTLEDAAQRGPAEAIDPLRKLVDEFKGQPQILEELARAYGKLGWRAERMRALAELAAKFPDDVVALRMYLEAIEEDGALADGDKIAERIKRLDPDAEVDLDRALVRQDWPAAIRQLRMLAKRRPDRKEIAGRIADVLARSGDPSAAMMQLSKALANQPLDATARFRLADAAYAKGDPSALRRALSESLQVGANGAELRAAISLLEGATDLEPYRVDGRGVIKEFEAWEKAGNHMDGNAARVLDYGATWVHPDGASEMLEHEIQRIQSQEAKDKESEIEPPTGLVLRLRVIKPDGTTLEPEQIAGKPTLTFPHLDVGDYIELEHITPTAGDGQKGKHYRGPHWFFREADKGYWRSEFVVVTPKEKELEVERYGKVADPQVKDVGSMFVEHRWRVDLSPPAPNEPDSPPLTEFLPSVRVGWGVTLEDTVTRLVDLAVDDTPLDPRLHRIALDLVRGTKDSDRDERARRLYRFAVEKIQEGKETDGRRVIMGRSGSAQAAFQHLLRQLAIPSELAIVKDSLATPPLGKMSEVEQYDGLLLRLSTDHGVRWMLVRDKFAPYGYVPAEMRGQPAYRLIPGTPKDEVSVSGEADAILYDGRADMRDNGSASVKLALTFSGNRSITWRKAFSDVPEPRRLDFVERMIVARTFDGGHVRELKLDNLDNVDVPLVLHMQIEVPQLARAAGQNLTLGSIFPQGLTGLATLPERQTPLLRRASWHTEVHFEVVVPATMRMPVSLPTGEVRHGGCVVAVKDAVHGHAIMLDRLIDFPAGRVLPGDDYVKYQAFAREADALYERETLIGH